MSGVIPPMNGAITTNVWHVNNINSASPNDVSFPLVKSGSVCRGQMKMSILPHGMTKEADPD